jgi:Uma2 family endonuclease
MTTVTSNYYDVVSQMQEGDIRVFHHVAWDEYEELLEQVGEARGLRISYNDGTLKVMSLSLEHEKYATFITRLMSQLSFRLRINILFSGSTTMRKKKKSKGNEPDAGFYIQTASVIGNRLDLDFEVDPAPDVVVEVDIHHDSTGSDPIYAALGVSEIWRYDGLEATIWRLQGNDYIGAEASNALPMITSAILTEYLTRMKQEGEFAAIIAFDEWLQSLSQ